MTKNRMHTLFKTPISLLKRESKPYDSATATSAPLYKGIVPKPPSHGVSHPIFASHKGVKPELWSCGRSMKYVPFQADFVASHFGMDKFGTQRPVEAENDQLWTAEPEFKDKSYRELEATGMTNVSNKQMHIKNFRESADFIPDSTIDALTGDVQALAINDILKKVTKGDGTPQSTPVMPGFPTPRPKSTISQPTTPKPTTTISPPTTPKYADIYKPNEDPYMTKGKGVATVSLSPSADITLSDLNGIIDDLRGGEYSTFADLPSAMKAKVNNIRGANTQNKTSVTTILKEAEMKQRSFSKSKG